MLAINMKPQFFNLLDSLSLKRIHEEDMIFSTTFERLSKDAPPAAL